MERGCCYEGMYVIGSLWALLSIRSRKQCVHVPVLRAGTAGRVGNVR